MMRRMKTREASRAGSGIVGLFCVLVVIPMFGTLVDTVTASGCNAEEFADPRVLSSLLEGLWSTRV